jgi:hypothetical protein
VEETEVKPETVPDETANLPEKATETEEPPTVEEPAAESEENSAE